MITTAHESKLTKRRHLLRCLSLAALGSIPRALASGYPDRPVKLFVGLAPGGAQDILARIIAGSLTQRLGQPFIVENRPGAGTNIATGTVVRSPGDGHTLLFVGAPNAINATLYPQLPFNFIRDIAPVAPLARMPEVLIVHPAVPAKTLPELINYAKANPGRLNMASPGSGTGPHMSGELLKAMAGIDITHIPYRGGAPAMTAVLAGQAHLMFIAPAVALDHIRSGKLRALAVTSKVRVNVLPGVPAISEHLPDYESGGFFGLGAPKSTPTKIVALLNQHANAALGDASIKRRIVEMGGIVTPGSPADLGDLIRRETEKWARVVRAAGIKVD